MTVAATAQEPQHRKASDYFVVTKNARMAVASEAADSAAEMEEKSRDVMNELFPRRSLCDWTDTMVFMVLPEKSEMVTRIFRDGLTSQWVSTMRMRHKILRYAGYTNGDETNRTNRINFVTDDDERHPYYYEIPNGTFEDYCLLKFGVPALAYLNEVETARRFLVGKTLVTKSDTYWEDTSYGEGEDEVLVDKDTEVRVVQVGVGSRRFPVKIIVEDKDGRQFFQNVAFSATNSGMRDIEFEQEANKYHRFDASFDMLGDYAVPSWHFKKYVGKMVFNRRSTVMQDLKGNNFRATAFSTFKITDIKSQRAKNSVKMTLLNLKNGEKYVKEMYFKDSPAAAKIIGERENIYENLFSEGTPDKIKGITPKHLAAIRQGKILRGFTEEEVRMVRDDEYEVTARTSRSYTWHFSSLSGKAELRVTFDKRTRRVTSCSESR